MKCFGQINRRLAVTIAAIGIAIFSLDATTARASELVNMRGTAPEQAQITVTVTKPASASEAVIALTAYDADARNEGELIINGNKPIALFGSEATGANNNTTAKVSLSTPAAYWRDGENTLVFKHLKTSGYNISQLNVTFDTDAGQTAPIQTGEPQTSTSTSGSSDGLPLSLRAAAPEQKQVTLTVSKPSASVSALLVLTGYDLDNRNEGELIINGNNPIALFGSEATGANDNTTATVSLSTPAAYWRDGDNTLLFRHTKTNGYTVDKLTVVFDVAETAADMGSTTTNGSTVDSSVTSPIDTSTSQGTTSLGTTTTSSSTASSGDTAGSTDSSGSASTGTIVIAGGTEATGSVSLSWSAPVARADGTPLPMSEISGYSVYYGTSAGSYTHSIDINDASASSTTLTDLPVGTYYLVMTTRDSGGRESGYSKVVSKSAR